MKQRTCIIAECGKLILCREVCDSHYRSIARAGGLDELPHTPRPRRDPAERFWEKVDKTDDCWLWLARTDKDGYGLFKLGGITSGAHRAAYQLSVGPIPDGLTLDHLCRVRHCVRPDHLEPVTFAENIRRREGVVGGHHGGERKTHCVNGHQFTPDNTKVRPNGSRKCRACDRDHAARAYMRRKGLIAA